MVLLWHTKDNSVNLLLKMKWLSWKLPVLFSFYIGPFYLNVVPWLKKLPADTSNSQNGKTFILFHI